MNSFTTEDTRALASSLTDAISEGRFDEAESTWHVLREIDPLPVEVQTLPALIMIGRGDARGALQHLNSLPDTLFPQLRVLCLRMLGDPTWDGSARALEDHPDEAVRDAVHVLRNTPMQ